MTKPEPEEEVRLLKTTLKLYRQLDDGRQQQALNAFAKLIDEAVAESKAQTRESERSSKFPE